MNMQTNKSIMAWKIFILSLIFVVALVVKVTNNLWRGPIESVRIESVQIESVPVVFNENGTPRVIVAVGPKDKNYLKHSVAVVDFELILDTETNHFNVFRFGDDLQEQANSYHKEWVGRVGKFRRLLCAEGVNNVDPGLLLQDAPFRKENLTITDRSLESGDGKSMSEFSPGGNFQVNPTRFEHCMEFPTDCGDVTTPPVVDISLVIPLNLEKYNMTWPTLESIRQLVVFPREIVFAVNNFDGVQHEAANIFSLINIIRDMYYPSLPPGVHIKFFLSNEAHRAGEMRWFGFNYTSSPVVSLFDSDDYMHPQLFQVFDALFSNQLELDHALVRYNVFEEAGTACFVPVLDLLRKNHYTTKQIFELISYSSDDYQKVRDELPTFGRDWWLGNTDTEPGWHGRRWYDPDCANGWQTFRRHVMEAIPPPTNKRKGQDSIHNWRVIRAGFNYKCFPAILGLYLHTECALDGTSTE